MPSRPGILDPRYDKNRIREKKFALKMILGRRYGEAACHHQVNLALGRFGSYSRIATEGV